MDIILEILGITVTSCCLTVEIYKKYKLSNKEDSSNTLSVSVNTEYSGDINICDIHRFNGDNIKVHEDYETKLLVKTNSCCTIESLTDSQCFMR